VITNPKPNPSRSRSPNPKQWAWPERWAWPNPNPKQWAWPEGGVAWRSRDSCGPMKNLYNRTNVPTFLHYSQAVTSLCQFQCGIAEMRARA